MKKLLEILSNPSKRMPLETLLKCEVVLEKLDFKRVRDPVLCNLLEHANWKITLTMHCFCISLG
jgi:hypothetical protein